MGRIVCGQSEHLARPYVRCKKKCPILCSSCRIYSIFLKYVYKCNVCNYTYCIHHFILPNHSYKSTHSDNASLLDCFSIRFLTQCFGKRPIYTLIFKASQDGFTPNDFHHKCDGQSNTLTIVRNTYNKVFGGYTPIKWDS